MSGRYSPPTSINQAAAPINMTTALRDYYGMMDSYKVLLPPLALIQTMRNHFPQFAERDSRGFKQQDAEECWSMFETCLKSTIDANSPGMLDHQGKCVERYMMGELVHEYTCDENAEEEKKIKKEAFSKLQCHITQSNIMN